MGLGPAVGTAMQGVPCVPTGVGACARCHRATLTWPPPWRRRLLALALCGAWALSTAAGVDGPAGAHPLVSAEVVRSFRECNRTLRSGAYGTCQLSIDGLVGGGDDRAWQTHRFMYVTPAPAQKGIGQLALSQGFDVATCDLLRSKAFPRPGPNNPCTLTGAFNSAPAVLISHPWGHNFNHFLSEALPKLHLAHALLRAVLGPGPPLFVLVEGAWGLPFQRQAVELLGIDTRSVLPWMRGRAYKGPGWRELWVPSHTSLTWEINAASRATFRALRAGASAACPAGTATGAAEAQAGGAHAELLFFSRKDAEQGQARAMTNEPELGAQLAKLGFVQAEFGALSLCERARLLAHARVVVHAFGAGVHNMAFTPSSSTRWVILCDPFFCAARPGTAQRLAEALELQAPVEVNVLGPGKPPQPRKRVPPRWLLDTLNRPYAANVSHIVQQVQQLLAEQHPGPAGRRRRHLRTHGAAS